MRHSREAIDNYFEYGVFPQKRLVYIGSLKEDSDGQESGVDYLMTEKAIKSITYLNTMSEKPIIIITDNPGGDLYHGLAIYDIIKSSRCHVTIIAVGYCCSMASIILQAADLRIISPNCSFLIHDGTMELSGHTRNVESQAQQSKVDRNKIYEIYYDKMKEKNSKITIKKIEQLCTIDKIYSPQETINIGLADELLQDINFYIKE